MDRLWSELAVDFADPALLSSHGGVRRLSLSQIGEEDDGDLYGEGFLSSRFAIEK